MEIVHAGFDALYVAFRGAVAPSVIETLAAAKKEAEEVEAPVLRTFGDLRGHVMPNGGQGGYAFMFDTGPLGAVWKFKNNISPDNWNLFVEVRALALATQGYAAIREQIMRELEEFGARVIEAAINRADYAVDIVPEEGFELKPDCFICHSGSTISQRFEEETHEGEGFQIVGNRRISSVTIGRNPGRVVMVYNKRREQRQKGRSEWFAHWGFTPEESPEVWRVEIRAHKRYLKFWNIETFEDFEAKIGDLLKSAVDQVRLINSPDVANVTRAVVDPLWSKTQDAIKSGLSLYSTGATSGRVREARRADVVAMYESQMRGLSAGLAVALGVPLSEVWERLPNHVLQIIRSGVADGEFARAYGVAKDRYFWLEED
jgi:hypothetical protein